MIHKEKSELAGKTVKIKKNAQKLGGAEFVVEDWLDRVLGRSWMNANGNPACLQYAIRSTGLPIDDEVLYGKIGMLGHLVHISEIEIKSNNVDKKEK